MAKTIFITGASRGFGKLWAEAFLKRGDRVAVTARNLKDLKDLTDAYGKNVYPIQLDVNNREACFAAVNSAKAWLGSVDVVINNAGYGLFGTIEETTEKEARDQIETNVFGLLWVTQAAIPLMREQGHGHIIQVSSVLGLVTSPVMGIYAASKFAVEAIGESLAQEVKAFGIRVTLIEPSLFGTDWSGASAVHTKGMPVYDGLKKAFYERVTPDSIGKPEATIPAILMVVDAINPPLRLTMGKPAYPWIQNVYQDRLANWEGWKDVAATAHG